MAKETVQARGIRRRKAILKGQRSCWILTWKSVLYEKRQVARIYDERSKKTGRPPYKRKANSASNCGQCKRSLGKSSSTSGTA